MLHDKCLRRVRKLSTKTEDNNVTTSDVTTSAASSKMPNAACAGSAKRTNGQRKSLVHRSTPNIAATSQAAATESRRPTEPSGIDGHVRSRSASRGRQSTTTTAATNELSNRRPANSTSRSVTSRNVSRTTTAAPVPRPTTPTLPSSSKTATSPRQPTATNSTLTTSKKLFRSTGNLTTTSPAALSPPPKRRMSSNIAAVPTKASHAVAARQQSGSADSKHVVISGRGRRTQPASAAAASTHDGGGKNAAMRSRIGIVPNMLLPNCYQPGKATPATPVRSFSIDASVTASSPDVAATSVTAAASSPSIRRSISVQERHTSPPLQAKPAFDSYPEPPPEDKELNSRMEMLFEEYRKVERGLIFSDEQSSGPDNSTANNCSSSSPRPSPTTSSRSSAGGVAETATAGKRVGQTIGSMRAKSVGNLAVASSPRCVSSAQQRSDRAAHTTSSSPAPETSLSVFRAATTSSARTSTVRQRGQSSPGIGRRSAPPPATPPPSRKNAVSDGVRSRPRQQTGKIAAAPAATCHTNVTVPASASIRQARSCGGAGVTRVRRDSLPVSLQDVSAAAAAHNVSSARVDATKQSKRRPSMPSCAVSSSCQRTVRVNKRNAGSGSDTGSEMSRRTAAVTASDSNSTVSANDNQSGYSADQVAIKLLDTERRSRSSTVGPRSFIPRPVSCSGGRPASRRDEGRDPPTAKKPERFEPVLRREDSGVDVAAAGLSPSDDGVGLGNLEAVVQRLSASLESCTIALLADNDSRSPTWQTPTTVDAVDDEYY